MKTIKSTYLGLFAVLLSPMAANAVVIWDEGVDGDLGSSFSGRTDLGLIADDSSIVGTLDGAGVGGPIGPDEFDIATVSFDNIWTLDISDVFGQSLTIALQSTVATLLDITSVGVFLGDNIGVFADNIFGEIAAGDYVVQFIPSGNQGALSYVATFNVFNVPEPGTLALLGIGLFGMGLSRRKKA